MTGFLHTPAISVQWKDMKYVILTIVALLVLGGGAYMLLNGTSDSYKAPETENPVTPDTTTPATTETVPEPPITIEPLRQVTIGTSAAGTPLTAYQFGTGSKELLLIGGVHGGYAANTVELADNLRAYFTKNVSSLPAEVTVTIIPVLNPDGLKTVTGRTDLMNADGTVTSVASVIATASNTTAGRFNDNDVDINRNFDCDWAATGVWRDQTVSGGSAAFSEPEAAALKEYIETYDPAAVVVWFSAEGKVYPGTCGSSSNTASIALTKTFATAAGYPSEAEFDAYAVNGDMVNWMTKIGTPAISVLLTNHTNAEYSKNLAGVNALIKTLTE